MSGSWGEGWGFRAAGLGRTLPEHGARRASRSKCTRSRARGLVVVVVAAPPRACPAVGDSPFRFRAEG